MSVPVYKTLKQCDHIATKRYYMKNPLLPFWHHGVYIGNGKVVHYGVDDEDKMPIKIQIVSLNTFCKGNLENLKVIKHKRVVKKACMKRVEQSLNKGLGKYHFYYYNCEHYANWVINGKPYSAQSKVLHKSKRKFEKYMMRNQLDALMNEMKQSREV